MADKKLEERLREEIEWALYLRGPEGVVHLDPTDAKRLLYRLKKENSAPQRLVFRRDELTQKRGRRKK